MSIKRANFKASEASKSNAERKIMDHKEEKLREYDRLLIETVDSVKMQDIKLPSRTNAYQFVTTLKYENITDKIDRLIDLNRRILIPKQPGCSLT